jgi:hypothetical protein
MRICSQLAYSTCYRRLYNQARHQIWIVCHQKIHIHTDQTVQSNVCLCSVVYVLLYIFLVLIINSIHVILLYLLAFCLFWSIVEQGRVDLNRNCVEDEVQSISKLNVIFEEEVIIFFCLLCCFLQKTKQLDTVNA